MAKTISQLKAEKLKLETELEQCQHRLRRLEQRKSYYEKGERQKRAHRLITRGAAVESLAPSVKGMAEPDFYALMEQILSIPEVRSILPREDG